MNAPTDIFDRPETWQDIARECRAGWICDCDSPERICHTLSLAARSVAQPNYTFNPRENIVLQYSRATLTHKLADVLEHIAT